MGPSSPAAPQGVAHSAPRWNFPESDGDPGDKRPPNHWILGVLPNLIILPVFPTCHFNRISLDKFLWDQQRSGQVCTRF